ncbi:hypothetical protein CPB84DRAFT_1760327 [Gymnopilus junonius]|uniref:Uncharacterized protein n=1 Tax=Gymnopilus junonius TaxID=109634 RepID=A0A9P5TUN3_GYMJU|nr:hypothetical protein CPB84DRAFT_1760327 [Gymnopilus junonius]
MFSAARISGPRAWAWQGYRSTMTRVIYFCIMNVCLLSSRVYFRILLYRGHHVCFLLVIKFTPYLFLL